MSASRTSASTRMKRTRRSLPVLNFASMIVNDEHKRPCKTRCRKGDAGWVANVRSAQTVHPVNLPDSASYALHSACSPRTHQHAPRSFCVCSRQRRPGTTEKGNSENEISKRSVPTAKSRRVAFKTPMTLGVFPSFSRGRALTSESLRCG